MRVRFLGQCWAQATSWAVGQHIDVSETAAEHPPNASAHRASRRKMAARYERESEHRVYLKGLTTKDEVVGE
jgi:hypothetical protein